MDIEALYRLFSASEGVTTDTRELREGQLFFALRGPSFNGNDYALEALRRGALGAVVDEEQLRGRQTGIHYVPNALQALQDLARHHRRACDVTLIAITGSNGKTTTKELMQAVLSEKHSTLATLGTRNNHIGVPLTLLDISAEHRLVIIEMGASAQGEIKALCDIAEPDLGYITNFGQAHLEGFGGIQGVIEGKSELYDFLRSKDRRAFVNMDDPTQVEKSAGLRRIGFGEGKSAEIRFRYKRAQRFAELTYRNTTMRSQLIGDHNLTNIATAVTAGITFEVDTKRIQAAIERYTPHANRSQLISRKNYQIILDAYNANPSSMAASLETVRQLDGPTWVVLGDMAELGTSSAQAHQGVVDLLADLNPERVFLVGTQFYNTRAQPQFEKFKTYEAFAQALKSLSVTAQHLLVKGSRNMALERMLELV